MPEAEIIREGVHLAAMASWQWDEPFFEEPIDLGGRVSREEIRQTAAGPAGPSPDRAAA